MLRNRLIATDVVSSFHLLSVLHAMREVESQRGRRIEVVDIWVLPNARGSYLANEGTVALDGRTLRYHHSGVGPAPRMGLVPLITRVLVFSIGRLAKSRRRPNQSLWLSHHTYFKPSSLLRLPATAAASVITIAFEEGIGTHGGLSHHGRTRAQHGVRWPRLKYLIRRLLATTFFVDHRTRLLASPDVPSALAAIDDLRVALRVEGRAWVENAQAFSGSDNLRLFVGSPLREAGLVGETEYESILRALVKDYPESRFLAKPHPIEEDSGVYERAGMRLVEHRAIPAEILLADLPVAAVHGFNSGLLIMASALSGRKSVCESSRLPERARKQLAPSGRLASLFEAHTVDIPAERRS